MSFTGEEPYLSDGKSKLKLTGLKPVTALEAVLPNSFIQSKPNLPRSGVNLSGAQFSATLFNGMVAPFTALNIRGAIWYQGCSDCGSPAPYARKQVLLVRGWREAFRDAGMPFIITQLSAYETNRNGKLPDNYRDGKEPDVNIESYPAIREAQELIGTEYPGCGLAVTIDVGDHSDIHPTRKESVGYRLAKEAERLVYGHTEPARSPVYERMEVEKGAIRIHFKYAPNGLSVSKGSPDDLKEFAIAGADGKYVWANAKIDGDTVVVSSKQVPEPKSVRYAWSQYPGNVNLISKEGYPVSPFRTDRPDYLSIKKAEK